MIQTLRIYGRCLARIPGALALSPWVIAVPLLYSILLTFAATALAPLDIAGGFILGLIWTAVVASGLSVVGELLGGRKVSPPQLIEGVRAYFWPVMNVGFVAWIAGIVIKFATTSLPNGAALVLAINGVAFVLLNATPETIYLRRVYGGMEVLSTAFAFIQEHWIEWFVPNVLLVVAGFFVMTLVDGLLPPTFLGRILDSLVPGAILLPFLLFRGFLFDALDGRRRGGFKWASRG